MVRIEVRSQSATTADGVAGARVVPPEATLPPAVSARGTAVISAVVAAIVRRDGKCSTMNLPGEATSDLSSLGSARAGWLFVNCEYDASSAAVRRGRRPHRQDRSGT